MGTANATNMAILGIILAAAVFAGAVIFFFIFDSRRHKLYLQRLKEQEDMEKNVMSRLPGGVMQFLLSSPPKEIYHSAGLPALFGKTEEAYREWVKNGLVDAVLFEEDRDPFRVHIKEAMEHQKPFEDTFRILQEDGSFEWIHVTASQIRTEKGIPVFSAIFTRLPQEAAMYMKIVNESGTAVYVCSEKTFEILFMSDRMRQLFPEAKGNYAGRKCYEFFMGRYSPCPFCRRELLQTDALTVRDYYAEEKKKNYRFEGKRIDWNGVPAVINYVKDETERFLQQRRTEENYHTQITLMSDVSPNALGTYHLNLTRNTIGLPLNPSSAGLQDGGARSVDEFFENAYEHCASSEDEKAYSEIFNRVKLQQSFNEGVTKFSLDHGYFMKPEAPTWITTAISMAQNPQTGDIEAILYTIDIRKRKIAESMLKTVADNDYDYISLIDLNNDTYQEVFGRNVPKAAYEATEKKFSEVMEKNVRENCANIDIDGMVEQLSLRRVKAELLSHRRYNVYNMEYDRTGARRHKLISFVYIDRTRSLVCMTCVDVTDEHEQERKIREKYDAALEASRRLINAPMQILTSTEKYSFDGRHILLAEDHPLNAEIAKNLLEKVGFEVAVVGNGQEAVDQVTKNEGRYDAVLMDIRMPVKDGLAATKEIRAIEREDVKNLPIIAMTAVAFEEDIERSLAAGMNGHLAKPIDPNKLYETLKKFLK